MTSRIAPPRRSRLRKILAEPVLHFLVLGAALFYLAGLSGDETPRTEDATVVVSEGRIKHLSNVFVKTWQRPPSRQELEGMVDDFILEEVYYRRAKELGIDRDDLIIRRRLRQKLEFLTDDAASFVEPDDEELKAFLDANPERFREDSIYTFKQVLVKQENHPGDLKEIALDALKRLRSGEDVPSESRLLGEDFQAADAFRVDRTFGRGFAGQLDQVDLGEWQGPVSSGMGLHLVLLEERIAGEVPELSVIRTKVAEAWLDQKRLEMRQKVNDTLKGRYEIVIEWPDEEK